MGIFSIFSKQQPIAVAITKEIQADSHVAKLSIVGVGMRSHAGIAEKMFSALAEANVNIQMISTSEIKISCVIDEASAEKALRTVHKAFGLEKGPATAGRLKKMQAREG